MPDYKKIAKRIPWNKGKKLHYDVWNKGKKNVQVISEKTWNNPYFIKSRFKKGHTFWKHPNAIRTQIKKGMKLKRGHSGLRGKDNPKWKGGRSGYLSKQVKIRDNYTCQICGLRDIEIMEVDHIKPKIEFPELKYEINNLMTLCQNCHRRRTNNYLKIRLSKKYDRL